jgi:uncharacterized membrane protein YphA (DoxX/SURF4 family)
VSRQRPRFLFNLQSSTPPMPRLTALLCLLFGGAFIYAGVMKAQQPMVFLDDVRSFQILHDPYAAWVAMGLPWLEIFAGLAVVTGILRSGGLLILNASLIVFVAASTFDAAALVARAASPPTT